MPLSDYIALNEVLTSGQLANHLTTTGLTPAAARQVISRNNDPAVLVLPFRLPRRSRLFTLRASVQNEGFYHRLAEVIAEFRPGLARTILVLLKRRILLRADAQRLLAAPLKPNSSRTPTYDADVSRLTDLQFCSVEDSDTALERLTINSLVGRPRSHQLARSERARQIVDMYLTHMITDQFRNQGVIGWTSATLADLETGTVRFSDHAFSAFGYSWLDPLVRRAVGKRPKPIPVLFDVYSRECDVHDVLGFLHRLARIGSNRNARMPVLGVLAADGFSGDAWSVAKKHGLLVINLRQSYGDAALAMLARLERLLRGAVTGDGISEQAATIDYEELASEVDALRGNPYIAELRSFALEVTTAVLLRSWGWEDVWLRRKFKFNDRKREVDVVGKSIGGSRIYLVECKAAHTTKELDPEEVRKFFTETVSAALKDFRRVTNVTKCKAEIWTTGLIGESAKTTLSGLKLSTCVVPKLREKNDIIDLVGPPLVPCKRLIETLSLHPQSAQGQSQGKADIGTMIQ